MYYYEPNKVQDWDFPSSTILTKSFHKKFFNWKTKVVESEPWVDTIAWRCYGSTRASTNKDKKTEKGLKAKLIFLL